MGGVWGVLSKRRRSVDLLRGQGYGLAVTGAFGVLKY